MHLRAGGCRPMLVRLCRQIPDIRENNSLILSGWHRCVGIFHQIGYFSALLFGKYTNRQISNSDLIVGIRDRTQTFQGRCGSEECTDSTQSIANIVRSNNASRRRCDLGQIFALITLRRHWFTDERSANLRYHSASA
jgi:hypothetical protein